MWFGFISKILVFSLVHSNGTQTNQLLKLVVNKKTKQNYNMLNMQDAKRHKNTINLQTLEKKTYIHLRVKRQGKIKVNSSFCSTLRP
jgi:hypothetical protein